MPETSASPSSSARNKPQQIDLALKEIIYYIFIMAVSLLLYNDGDSACSDTGIVSIIYDSKPVCNRKS